MLREKRWLGPAIAIICLAGVLPASAGEREIGKRFIPNGDYFPILQRARESVCLVGSSKTNKYPGVCYFLSLPQSALGARGIIALWPDDPQGASASLTVESLEYYLPQGGQCLKRTTKQTPAPGDELWQVRFRYQLLSNPQDEDAPAKIRIFSQQFSLGFGK